jgi:hypothetical protein
MSLKRRLVTPSLLVLLSLTSCVSAAHHVRYLAELEPPVQYSHPYDGPVDERVMPVAKVRALCTSVGATGYLAACGWVSADGTCHIVLPNNYQAPVDTYRRHEIAHCNGWPADHPHDATSSLPDTREETDTVDDTTN